MSGLSSLAAFARGIYRNPKEQYHAGHPDPGWRGDAVFVAHPAHSGGRHCVVRREYRSGGPFPWGLRAAQQSLTRPTARSASTLPPASPGTKNVSVKLVSAVARDTEDVCCWPGTPSDEFYVLGNVSVGENRSDITMKPRSITRGRSVSIDQTLLEVNVPNNAAIHLSMNAFDEDLGKIFQHLPDVVNVIGTVCGIAAPFDPSGTAAACTAAIPRASGIAELLKGADPDDHLGALGKDWAVSSLADGSHVMSERFYSDSGGWWSSWDYDLVYEITVS